ncbi:MAG TPA: prepilin-type N-terminal cleavage/methylation domain-containing protein [Nitrospirota bacterium]
MKPAINKSGFTLIELMIAVAIIGILAAIAIPNYMRYMSKAKQAEAKSNLKGIFTVETTYYSEHNVFVTDFTGMVWEPVGPFRYAYSMGGGIKGLNIPFTAEGNDPPGADAGSFTAVAWGNIDSDPAFDTWQINNKNELENRHNDILEAN